VSRIEQPAYRTKRNLREEGVQPGGDQMVSGFDISASKLTNSHGKNPQRACGDFPMCPPTSLRMSLMGVTKPRAVASSLRWKRALRKAARPCLLAVFASALPCVVPASAIAQQGTAGGGIISRSPPDAPPPPSDPQNSAQQSRSAEGSASVTGTVRDLSGAVVSGADVTLRHGDGTQLLVMMSETTGEFSFAKIPAGSYLVMVNAKGFAPFTSAEFAVGVQQDYEVPDVSLSIATANMEVTVRPTDLIAAEQIRAEEKQRLVGVIPNFYTSYIHDAAPLNWKQKFSLAARSAFDPVAFIGVGFGAAIEQATNAYPGYGQGAAGYRKRYAATFADGRSSDFLTNALFPALLRQDPRYYYQGSGSFKSRFMHAVSSVFVTRSDSGRTVANSSYLLGELCSGALSNLYYPQANRGANLVFGNAAAGLAGRVGMNLFREFLSKRLTRKVLDNGRL
jgi:Carboxypeptidase regulatory-like domain